MVATLEHRGATSPFYRKLSSSQRWKYWRRLRIRYHEVTVSPHPALSHEGEGFEDEVILEPFLRNPKSKTPNPVR
jgi:hypothetical protein